MNDALELLNKLGIRYTMIQHPPLFTVEDEKKHYPQGFQGTVTKNLFLQNRQGDRYYLVVLPTTKRADIKNIAAILGESGLRFGTPEKMMEYLGVEPGHVSPLGLIYDKDHALTVLVDEAVLANGPVNCSPNQNTATVSISPEDFKKFLAQTGNDVKYTQL